MKSTSVLLGFEVGNGEPVEIPLAHTFVTGQTQLSGKTTTLRAIVERSGRRALAFVTKRGEEFAGQPIRPYLPRRHEQPIHWRLVETMLASSLDQKRLASLERLWLIKAAKGAYSLEDVQRNVRGLLSKTKSDRSQDVYTLLDEYLELVVPEMRSLNASEVLDLQPGLNVMTLGGLATQTQAMVIRAALERINLHEEGVLTVFPEAWEFAPRGRNAPAKDEAIAMARKGAVLGNYLLCDSQDIAGVETTVRQAASVWILGVQRELNELRRTIQMIPAGIKRPKPEDVATLELGQFYACWGRHAVKTFVQPAWMDADQARKVATGAISTDQAIRHKKAIEQEAAWVERRFIGRTQQHKEDEVNAAEAQTLREDNERLATENARLTNQISDLRRRLDTLETRRGDHALADARPPAARSHRPEHAAPAHPDAASIRSSRAFTIEESFDHEALYQAFKARLIAELPSDPRVMEIVVSRPELQVKVKRATLEVDGNTLRGRIAQLMTEGFLDELTQPAAVIAELKRRGAGEDVKFNAGKELQALTTLGFLLREGIKGGTRYQMVPGMKVNILEGAAV